MDFFIEKDRLPKLLFTWSNLFYNFINIHCEWLNSKRVKNIESIHQILIEYVLYLKEHRTRCSNIV